MVWNFAAWLNVGEPLKREENIVAINLETKVDGVCRVWCGCTRRIGRGERKDRE
jgi:hypothetical protein